MSFLGVMCESEGVAARALSDDGVGCVGEGRVPMLDGRVQRSS